MKRLFVAAAVMLIVWTAQGQNIVTSDTTINTRPALRALRLSVQGGYAWRLGKIDDSQGHAMSDHLKGLRHGYTYGADLTWFFLQNFGVGVKGNVFHSGNSSENITMSLDNGKQVTGRMEDNVNIWFIGPMASWRCASRNLRHIMLMNLGVGYLGYRDKAVFVEPFKMKGGTTGLLYEIGYDYSLSDRIAIGVMLSSLTGALRKYNTMTPDGNRQVVKLEKGSYENLSHINLSVGLRINL